MRPRRSAAALAAACTLATLAVPAAAQAAPAPGYSINKTLDVTGNAVVERWAPCKVIHYVVNVDVLPGKRKASGQREVKSAVSALAKASGLRFKYDGHTSQIPTQANASSRVDDLVIAWVHRNQTDYQLGGGIVGEGGFNWSSHVEGDSQPVSAIDSGFVVLDADATKSWPSKVKTRGVNRTTLVMHELGHAVGLDHVNDPHEVMNPALTSQSPATYGAGDRSGLALVGNPEGCS